MLKLPSATIQLLLIEKNGRPFGVASRREIQLSKRDVLDLLTEARKGFATDAWKSFLLRSIGLETNGLSERQIKCPHPPHGSLCEAELQLIPNCNQKAIYGNRRLYL
jgi:hypothetical protein